jgi:tetratricopeptide (TPR) repeat protein
MERIVLKCLEKEPENRYQSAKELGLDLRRLGGPSTATVTAAARPASRQRAILVLASTLVIAAALALGGYLYFHRGPKLTEKDSIIVADFANATGDPVFDVTLRQGLSAQLNQTPFLSLVSGDEIAETLRLMEKPPDTRLTQGVAREVCRRTNATAEIEGSIALLGSQYVIGLDAVNCGTGESLAEEQATAESKEKVLVALGTASSALRTKLGESAASLQTYDAPLDKVTTPSLEALQAWGLGNQAMLNEDLSSAASSLQRAVSLDPNFAAAYSTLGVVYSGLGEETLSIENARKGYELRDRASDRERFSIESYYDIFVMGNLEKGTEVAEQWARLFPRDLSALGTLNAAYYSAGRINDALTAAREMARLDRTAQAYHAVAMAYTSLGRLDEARATIREAEANRSDPSAYSDVLYNIAFLQNDQKTMAQLLKGPWASPYLAPVLEFYTAAYSGHLSHAREAERNAISSATQRGALGFIPSMEGTFALVEALEGNFVQARNDIRNAGDLSVNPNFDVVGEAAMVAALSGDAPQAQKLADELNKRFPEATVVQFTYLPAVRGLLVANRGNAQEAAEDLDPLSSHERVIPLDWVGPYMTPVYLRGEAHLALHHGAEAVTDFQMIIDNAGFIVNCPIGALADLGLGRAYALQGDTGKARTAYQDFLALWKDADPDVPIFKQAKAEYAKLR